MSLSVKLKKYETYTYEEICKNILLLRERFTLGYNSIEVAKMEYDTIMKHVNKNFVLNDQEKKDIEKLINNIKLELPDLNKERNLPYNKLVNSIILLEEDFLLDSYLRLTAKELEEGYVRILNQSKNRIDITAKEKVLLEDLIRQKIVEIPQLEEKRKTVDKVQKEEKSAAIDAARKRYKEQSFFEKFKQKFITFKSINQMEDGFDFMTTEDINDLYKPKPKLR